MERVFIAYAIVVFLIVSVVPSQLVGIEDHPKAPAPPFEMISKVSIGADYASKYPPVPFEAGILLGDAKGRLQYIVHGDNWMSVSIDGSDIASAPALVENNAVIGTMAGAVACVAVPSGEVKWVFNTRNAIIGKPLIVDDKVYFGSADESFYCLDLSDGTKVFEYRTNAPIWSTPCVIAERVIFGGDDDSIHCLNRITGELMWTFNGDGWFEAEPVVHDAFVFLGSLGGSVYMINGITGELDWQVQLTGAIHSKGARVGERYFTADDSGTITCLDIYKGEIIWQRTDYVRVDTPLTTNGELLYFTNEDKEFVCLDLDGNQLWRKSMIHAVRSGVLLDKDALIMISSDGYLERWKECGYIEISPEDRYLGNVREDDGHFTFQMDIVIGREDGRISPGAIGYQPFEAGKRCKAVQFEELDVSCKGDRRVYSYRGHIDVSDPSFCDGLNDFVVYFGADDPLMSGNGAYQFPNSDGMVYTRFTFDLVSGDTECQTCEPCYRIEIIPSDTPYFKRTETGGFEIQISTADDIDREIELRIEGIRGIESQELKLMQVDGFVSYRIEFDCMELPGGSYFSIPATVTCRMCPKPNDKMRSDWHSNRVIDFTTDPRLRIDMKPNSVDVLVNGDPVRLDVPARIIDGRTLVPIRFVAETFGCDVSWEQDTKKVTIIKDEKVLVYWAYQKTAKFNGIEVEIDVAPIIERGRTLVPFRSVAESLGACVRWIAPSRDIIIDWEF